jgi:hypothetical protein
MRGSPAWFSGDFPVHLCWAKRYDKKNEVIEFSKNQIQKRFCFKILSCSQHAATNSEITNPELYCEKKIKICIFKIGCFI